MNNLIYYPNFESSDLEWLKFALIYIDNFSPIIPDSGDKYLSELYKKLNNETDLLNLHRPSYDQGHRATSKAIRFVTKVIKNPYLYIEQLNSVNAVREWKNLENQTYTLFDEKYTGEWRYFCKDNKLIQDSKNGLLISKNLGELYMTFLAQEVAYQLEASPITDKRYLDNLSITLRTKDVSNDNKIEVAKSIIEYQLPLDFRKLDIDDIIKIRNNPDFKSKQLAFHKELNKTYDSIGNAIEPEKFINSYRRTLNDWTTELGKFGIEMVTFGLSAYILMNNDMANTADYLAKMGELGITMLGGYSLVKNMNQDTDRKYCRQYLTEIRHI
ncbi:MAG: hypothetical protein KAH72_03805 [Flavobacteriaceae bacterium]|nr:hypothetical protein [Flavobacteriaceae bacterium]